jgi:hypothetical protein
MSKDEETQKPTEESKDAAAPKQRKIVRRSASTRDNPAFTDAPASAEGAPDAAAAPSGDAPAAAAPAAAPAPTEGGAAPAHRRFDARAPRPRPAAGEARPPRPARPPREGGDYRPPPARPVGARPIPGGPRAPSSSAGGDYRPPAARPVGARPVPGGPRAPAPEGARRFEGERRERRPEGDRRERRPEGERRERPAQAAAPAAAAKPAPKPAAPPPPPPSQAKAAAPPQKAAAPKPMPVFVPLARAGQVQKSDKPALTAKEALQQKTKAHAPQAKQAPKAAPKAEATFDAALVNATADEAVAAIGKAGDAAAALVDAWAAAGNAAAVVEVAESDAVPGAARKQARRAINVLRSRGVAIPTRSRVVKIDDRAEVSLEATLIPPDSSGTMAISVTSKDASGRYHIAEVLIREPIGILQAGSGWLSGSQLKEGRNRALEGLGVAPVVVPVEWARHRIAEAKKMNATSGQVLPLGFEGCKELVEPAPESAAHPLADLEGDITSDRATAAAPGSQSLHNEPEFRSWLPDRGALDELLQKVGERLGPQGVSDPEAVNKALSEEMEAATDRFFSPEVRAVVTARMRDAAISIRARKGDRRAEEVLLIARAIKDAGLITSPPREIPFLVAFFQKALGILAQQGGGQLRVPVAAGVPAAG